MNCPESMGLLCAMVQRVGEEQDNATKTINKLAREVDEIGQVIG